MTQNHRSVPTPDTTLAENPTFQLTEIPIQARGKLLIPNEYRDRYNISPGDYVDLEITVETTSKSLIVTDAKLDPKGRVRIPAKKCTLYKVTHGDTVDTKIHL